MKAKQVLVWVTPAYAPRLNGIDLIAECGFCNQAYLTNLFKAATGLTPLKYRNRLTAL